MDIIAPGKQSDGQNTPKINKNFSKTQVLKDKRSSNITGSNLSKGYNRGADKFNMTMNSVSSKHSGQNLKFDPSTGIREEGRMGSQDPLNNCPKCNGTSEKRPCEEWVQLLEEKFTDYINELFRKKMQEFIDFIEEAVDVEDQIDPEQDHVIHSFYRQHNTLQKMHENFRLLEYKRKKYILQKKDERSRSRSNSKSPGRAGKLDEPNLSPQ